jgi:misacylated tRNA(Ala) deacylase
MHTSQHLLSALLETRLNLPTLSWSLTTSPTPCYVELGRGMTVDEISSIQDEANRLVFEGRQVHVEVEELDMANGVPKLESGREVGRGLPSDYAGGVKRVVVIDGVDRNPCCGTHLPSLHNLQLFLLPHTEAVSRSSTTSARLYFLAGPRLITHLSNSHNLLTATAATLSCGMPQVQERVAQVVDERKKAEKRVVDLETELASQVATDLLKVVIEKEDEKLSVTSIHRTDDSSNTLGFLSAIAISFTNALLTSPAKDSSYLFILSSSPSSQTGGSTSIVLVFGSDEKKVKQAGEGIKTKLGVKGGGKGPRWSGKFVGVWKEGREDAAVNEVLGSVTGN